MKHVLHQKTQLLIDNFTANPAQAIVIVGKRGIGKHSVATLLATQLLETDAAALENHPYFFARGGDTTAISINDVRDIQHFLSLKATASTLTQRVALVVDADKMTPEAQNAFLKTLEEPPTGSVLLLTASDTKKLLPTILSRVQQLDVVVPDSTQLAAFFETLGYKKADIDRAMLMSGGLPGLMSAILAGQQDHPLVKATDMARNILRLDTFDRLALVDSLSKQREQCLETCYILQQMAELSLKAPAKNHLMHKQWQSVLQQAYQTEQALLAQAQPKLALTNLMLSL